MDTKLTQQSNSVDVVFTRFEEIEKKIFLKSGWPVIEGIYGIEFINDVQLGPFVHILLNINKKYEDIETSVKKLLNEEQQKVIKFDYVKQQPFQLK